MRLPKLRYDKKSSPPENLPGISLRRNCTARYISRQIADFTATLPLPDGNQDAHRTLEAVLDNLK